MPVYIQLRQYAYVARDEHPSRRKLNTQAALVEH
jgi:hypothetical protein